ncbi:MAG: hypothetical protein RMJ33_13820 [Saprospiraceae bacterium]|nr:hypothetical protein [Saprospiraceae bacterium]MDW8230906.1 hypothetical protein [Saprospiraceae bacterium]
MKPKILFLPMLLLGCACSSYYYAPNTLQTPHLVERHDAEFSVGGLRGPESSGFEAHISYAFSRRLALMVNHMELRGGNASQERWGKGRLTEGGLGVYFPMDDNTSNTVFLGWGSGYAFHQFPKESKAKLEFHRYFGQYGICVERGAMRLGTGVRLNYLQYRKGWIDYRLGEPDISKIELIEERSPLIFPELSVNLGIGSRPVWVNAFATIMEYDSAEELGLATHTFGLSLTFQVDHFWRAERASKIK